MKAVVLYTMDGCPHCINMKEQLRANDIDFLERNINEHEKEYDSFVKATENEYLPAFTLLEIDEEKNAKNIVLMAPDRDYNDINEAIDKVKKYLL